MTENAGMTQQQRDCLAAIENLIEEKGFSPSLAEIARAIGVPSVGNVHRLLLCLKERGKLTWLPGQARSIQIIPEDGPVACNACEDNLVEMLNWKTMSGQIVCESAQPCTHCDGGAKTVDMRATIQNARNGNRSAA